MNEKKKYLKLDDNFLNKPSTRMLMNGKDATFCVYMQLLTLAANTYGRLMYIKDTPYTVETLSILLRHSEDEVQDIIDTLVKLKLLEILGDGSFYLPELKDILIEEEKAELGIDNEE